MMGNVHGYNDNDYIMPWRFNSSTLVTFTDTTVPLQVTHRTRIYY